MSAPSQQLTDLYRRFADGAVDRREFMRQAAALGVAGVAASVLGPLTSGPADGGWSREPRPARRPPARRSRSTSPSGVTCG